MAQYSHFRRTGTNLKTARVSPQVAWYGIATMCSSKFLSFDGWWVESGYVSCQSVLQNLDPKSMARPHRKFLAGFDTCGC